MDSIKENDLPLIYNKNFGFKTSNYILTNEEEKKYGTIIYNINQELIKELNANNEKNQISFKKEYLKKAKKETITFLKKLDTTIINKNDLDNIINEIGSNKFNYNTLNNYIILIKKIKNILEKSNNNIYEAEEILELMEKAINYNNAYEKLILHNQRLISYVANQIKTNKRINTLDIKDLIQEGNIGLQRAIDKYNPNYDIKFATYAIFWIKQRIERSILLKYGYVKIPPHFNEMILKYYKEASKWYQEHEEELPDKEAIILLGLDNKKKETALEIITQIKKTAISPIPLNAYQHTDTQKDEIIDSITSSYSTESEADKIFLNEEEINLLKRTLNSKEILIISLKYGLNLSHVLTENEFNETLIKILTKAPRKEEIIYSKKKLEEYYTKALETLNKNPKQKEIIVKIIKRYQYDLKHCEEKSTYREEYTQRDLGYALGISNERIRQIKTVAENKLKKVINNNKKENLKSYIKTIQNK